MKDGDDDCHDGHLVDLGSLNLTLNAKPKICIIRPSSPGLPASSSATIPVSRLPIAPIEAARRGSRFRGSGFRGSGFRGFGV